MLMGAGMEWSLDVCGRVCWAVFRLLGVSSQEMALGEGWLGKLAKLLFLSLFSGSSCGWFTAPAVPLWPLSNVRATGLHHPRLGTCKLKAKTSTSLPKKLTAIIEFKCAGCKLIWKSIVCLYIISVTVTTTTTKYKDP